MTRHRYLLALSGGLGCASALAVALFYPAALTGWLAAFLFTSAIPLGALLIACMMVVIPGRWRQEYTPVLAPALLLLPLAFLALLPVVFTPAALYPWAGDTGLSGGRALYFSTGFFALRSLGFLLICLVLALHLQRRRKGALPAAIMGLIFLSLGGMVVSTDWVVALRADFHSSGFGLYFLSIQAAVALAVLVLAGIGPSPAKAQPGLHGALLLTALLLWIYFAFMQFFIIWSTNLPDLIGWYLDRDGIWLVIAWVIAALHFGPTLLLLFPPMRTSRAVLIGSSVAVLIGKWLEMLWLCLPGSGWPALLSALLATFGLGLLAIIPLLHAGERLAPPAPLREALHDGG